jgi:CubicO group peptidase (beta-lactamase class C family)
VPEIQNFSGVVAVSHAGRPVTTVATRGRTPSDRQQIASVSKVFAATLALMLAEDGTLALGDPVGRWLPEAPPPYSDVTLDHLLSHTSGLGHWEDVPGLDPSVAMDRHERLALIYRAPQLSEPGAAWRYTSAGFLLVGAVVETVGGKPYAELLTERILRPLALHRTEVGTRPADVVAGHHAGEPVEQWDLSAMTGSGDMWSTVDDLATFGQALDGGRLLSAGSQRTMRTPHATLPEPERSADGRLVITGYGYGLYLGTFDGEPVCLHTGDNPGYRAVLGWFPGGRQLVGLANDDYLDWDRVLAAVL